MNRICKRITALILVLLMTASLLASCSGEGSEKEDTPKTIATYDEYVATKVELGLTKDEMLFDLIEIDGEIRATVGVTSDEIQGTYGERSWVAYFTEHRYYSMDGFIEDVAKREKTKSTHEVALHADPAVDFILGGEPYLYTSPTGNQGYDGVQYFCYQNGESLGKNIVIPPRTDDGYDWDADVSDRSVGYNARAHLMLYEDVDFVGIDYGGGDGTIQKAGVWRIFIGGRMLSTPNWRPGLPEYKLCGLIGINGIPYALVYTWEQEMNGQVVNTLWEETRLVPLTPETTELSLEGDKIDGKATGGAFSDGKYGYYLCGTELWRTDGKKSTRLCDLIFMGVNEGSVVRSVRLLSDGRILVVADNELIELSGATETVEEQRKVYTVGVLNLYGPVSDLTLTFAKFNRASGEVAFTVKEFRDKASLNLALLSGEIAMVVTRDQFMLKNYVKQELLTPLDEVAPELFEKDVLIENVVDAARLNGICYYLPRHFNLRGESVNAVIMEEGQTFETQQEYYDFILEKDPNSMRQIMKRDYFTYFAQGIDEWIDWESNTCHFDDGTFEALLEFCGQGATQEEQDNYAMNPFPTYTGNYVLQDIMYGNYFPEVKEAKDYLDGLTEEDLAKSDWPTSNARVVFPTPSAVHEGYEMFTPHYFAVVDNEESREAAGEFMKWHFTEDVIEEFEQNSSIVLEMEHFSINQQENDRYIGRNRNGMIEEEINPAWDDDMKDFVAMNNAYDATRCGQEPYENTWKMIRQADHFQYFRNEVYDVMYEEAGRFFSGSITAKQAADYVQNRISLYLAEQG